MMLYEKYVHIYTYTYRLKLSGCLSIKFYIVKIPFFPICFFSSIHMTQKIFGVQVASDPSAQRKIV